MRKAITPIIATVLLILMTVVSVAVSFFWITSMSSNLQESAGSVINSGSGFSSCSRINLISVRGDEIVVQNNGCDNINNITLFINGELTKYDLSTPIAPGEAAKITYTAQELGNPLSVIVALNNGNTVSETILNCTLDFGCDNLEQTFEDYAIGTDIADIPSWTNIGTQNDDCYADVQLSGGDNEAYFYDFDDSNLADKLYTLPSASSGSGNSTVEMSIDFLGEDGSMNFFVIFYDDSDNILQGVLLGTGFCAVLEAPATLYTFFTQPGGGGQRVRWDNPVTYQGKHDWNIKFNEDDKTIRYFIDGVEIYADDGAGGTFNSYYQPAGGIAKIEFATGIPISLGGDGSDGYVSAYIDDINVEWI